MTLSKMGSKTNDKWPWIDKEMEEVKEFTYQGFVFTSNGLHNTHIKMTTQKVIW